MKRDVRRRENYKQLKEAGFNYKEANELKNRSKKTIEQMIQLKKRGK